MLTVVCWLWRGWRPVYEPKHVLALGRMLEEHLHMPYRFVCVTDKPFPGVECVPLWGSPTTEKPRGNPDCYRRLKLFADDSIGARYFSIDLDCVILGDITPLVTDDSFKILKGYAAPYNGSMWQVTPGAHANVWHDLNDEAAALAGRQRMADGRKPFGSDQVYLAHKLPNAPTWTPDDGVYQYVQKRRRSMHKPRIVFFAGRTKPWEAPEFERDYKRFLV